MFLIKFLTGQINILAIIHLVHRSLAHILLYKDFFLYISLLHNYTLCSFSVLFYIYFLCHYSQEVGAFLHSVVRNNLDFMFVFVVKFVVWLVTVGDAWTVGDVSRVEVRFLTRLTSHKARSYHLV